MSRRAGSRLAAVIVGTWLVAACSGGGDDTSSTTAPPTVSSTSTSTPLPEPTDTAAPEPPGLVVGFAAPGAGLLNRLSVGQQRGLQLALDDVNAAGGVLGGDLTQARAAASAGRSADDQLGDLVEEGADVVVGPVGSPDAVDLIAALRRRSLVGCAASTTAPSVTADGDAGVFFRMALRDDHLAREVADELTQREQPPARVMLVGRDDVYGSELLTDLSAELTARGVEVLVEAYPPRRVTFAPEAAAITAADPDLVVMAAFGEAPRLLGDVVAAGVPADRILGLGGFYAPRLATEAFPSDPTQADGLTVVATTGDRAFLERLGAVPAADDQIAYGAQMYDCVVTLALAAAEAGSASAADIADHTRSVTEGGRTCSNYADCADLLATGEDIDYDGATGGIAIDERGDITTARIKTAVVRTGQLEETATRDIDLRNIDLDEFHAATVFATQVQQLLRLLGYLEGDVTGVFDEATREAIRALQRDLGLPETGEFDDATEAALRERAGAISAGLTASVADIQRLLAEAGYYDGPIDGVFSAATRDAIRGLQRTLGVPETGIIDAATLRALRDRDPNPDAEEPDETEPPTTEAPETEAPTTPPTAAPATPPPESQPPATPPETQPPATQPPQTQPPETQPPETQPPPTEPPASTEPPVTEPPATEPPLTEPPTTEPPVTEPPDTEPPPPPDTGMLAVLAAQPRFSRLVELLRTAGYDGDLGQPGRLTLFAPTNAAFDAAPDLAAQLADPDQLSALLAYHLLEGTFALADLPSGQHITVHGATVDIVAENGTVQIGGARVVDGDLAASNGVIHAIDGVLRPPA